MVINLQFKFYFLDIGGDDKTKLQNAENTLNYNTTQKNGIIELSVQHDWEVSKVN